LAGHVNFRAESNEVVAFPFDDSGQSLNDSEIASLRSQ
jgi:hypothetical protein